MSTIAQHTNMPEHMLVTRLKSSLDRPNATFGDLMGAVLAAKAELEMFREASHCIGHDETALVWHHMAICNSYSYFRNNSNVAGWLG